MVPGAPDLTVIIPASNEQDYIDPCLAALLAQDQAAGRVQVIVAANACKDATEDKVRGWTGRFADRGWDLRLLSIPEPGKVNALNRAEAVADPAAPRVFLDADVICEPALLGQLRDALAVPQPRYATGTLQVAPARTGTTRRYARIWTELPFVKGGAVGAGLFAINAAGRARWGAFPDIISDDTFVRLNFTPDERVEVPARYIWPMIEGFGPLVRVRRRQDAGVTQLAKHWPDLLQNEGKASVTPGLLMRLGLTRPASMLTYLAVHFATRMDRGDGGWSRGR
ncbi:MAG: glycosyltransferase [Paracoccus sp. (in: a-proteobacteria)]|uniref:glycosyltransferase n=1 Tax=Paracoccus sp. TaxID=267 RepID=UPI0026DF44FB|nr:glycosyltransferase [Paracoccus sp. (in: a-proteobacteria)]MDO5612142.1 glycosyltransferase [Paracoccus sp. (in: a-proteobacteria)]